MSFVTRIFTVDQYEEKITVKEINDFFSEFSERIKSVIQTQSSPSDVFRKTAAVITITLELKK